MEHIRLGCVVAARAIEREMRETWGFEEFCNRSLTRHYYQDWGDLCDEDKLCNDLAVKNGERLLSAYDIPKELRIGYAEKIWIITEANRSATTVLFPHEY